MSQITPTDKPEISLALSEDSFAKRVKECFPILADNNPFALRDISGKLIGPTKMNTDDLKKSVKTLLEQRTKLKFKDSIITEFVEFLKDKTLVYRFEECNRSSKLYRRFLELAPQSKRLNLEIAAPDVFYMITLEDLQAKELEPISILYPIDDAIFIPLQVIEVTLKSGVVIAAAELLQAIYNLYNKVISDVNRLRLANMKKQGHEKDFTYGAVFGNSKTLKREYEISEGNKIIVNLD